MGMKSTKLKELVRVYEDLEKTIQGLRRTMERNAEHSLKNINVRKLIVQLARSKRRLERKIGNTFLLEKQHLKKRLHAITHPLHAKNPET